MEQEGPVTLVVRHRARADRRAEFEEWLRGITREALQCAGMLGCNVVRPSDPSKGDYLVFLRFDTFKNLEAWEESETRRRWLARLDPLTQQAPTREKHSGMEVWFTPPSGLPQPARHKMVVVTLLALYPLIVVVQLTLAPVVADWPFLVRTFVSAALLVCLMTYLAMPLATRLFSRWLYTPAG